MSSGKVCTPIYSGRACTDPPSSSTSSSACAAFPSSSACAASPYMRNCPFRGCCLVMLHDGPHKSDDWLPKQYQLLSEQSVKKRRVPQLDCRSTSTDQRHHKRMCRTTTDGDSDNGDEDTVVVVGCGEPKGVPRLHITRGAREGKHSLLPV